jgi:hypothetical protein
MEAAKQYNGKHLRWHERLIRPLRPYGDRGTSVGDAVRRAASDLGIEAAGRGFDALAEMVMAAAEAKGGASAV